MKKIGTSSGLRFEISSSQMERKYPGLAWLKVSVWFGDVMIWSQADNEPTNQSFMPVEWTWVDFLSGMARSWPWLMLENGYPIPVEVAHPGELQKVAQARWGTLPEPVAEEEEDRLFDFKMCHDLSQYMRGIFLHPLWLILEGAEYHIWSPVLNSIQHVSAQEIRAVLEEFGDYLVQHLAQSTESRAIHATKTWASRSMGLEREYLRLSSGLSDAELTEISIGYPSPQAFFEVDAASNDPAYWFAGNELLAAARMTAAYFPLKAQRILVEYVRKASLYLTPELDRVSSRCPVVNVYGSAGYEQGYGLAMWLRNYLQRDPDESIDCEAILLNWGVQLQEITLAEMPRLDALAVWGPRRGPIVFLNVASGTRSSTFNGRRTTIAHEICHLLCDRARALPFAEVLGGQVPKHSEQRARAFAAELLLPRSVAEESMREADNVVRAANDLAIKYKVSREVVMRQITNSSAKDNLTADEFAQIESWAAYN